MELKKSVIWFLSRLFWLLSIMCLISACVTLFAPDIVGYRALHLYVAMAVFVIAAIQVDKF
jgi:hypothetical protein